MPFPLIAALIVGSIVLAILIRPKLPSQGQKPAGLGDFNVPTAEVGREIPVLFGTRDLKGPNIVWYGDLKTKAIKAKAGKK